MEIKHSLTVAAPLERVWPLMMRPELVVESLPGVTLGSLDGEDFTGEMSVGLGPMRLRYAGEGILRYHASARAIHIDAKGTEAKGAGNAAAVVDVSATEGDAGTTRLDVVIDLNLQGKPAQFGRGILAEVIGRLATQFGRNLEQQILRGEAPAPQGPSDEVAHGPESASTTPNRGTGPSTPSRWTGADTRSALGVLAGAVIGAVLTAVLTGRRAPSVQITVIGSDDPAWVELARELVRRVR